jgi:hypothetical protein
MKQIVLRMFDSDLARRVEKGFDIHIAYSSSALLLASLETLRELHALNAVGD